MNIKKIIVLKRISKITTGVLAITLAVGLSNSYFNSIYSIYNTYASTAILSSNTSNSSNIVKENTDIIFPEKFSQDIFSFNKTTDEEYLELAKFLTDKDMMKYFYGIPFSFQNKEDALLYGLNRNPDGSAINKPTGKEAINYTIRSAEYDNSIVGQISFSYPKYGSMTTYGDHNEVLKKVETASLNISYLIGSNFHGHSYAFNATKVFIDEFYKLNEKSKLDILFKLECNPENVASLKTIKKLGAIPLPELTDEYRYYKKSVSDTMCEVKIEKFQNEKLCDVTTMTLPKRILHKSLLDLKEGDIFKKGEYLTIKEYKFFYEKIKW